MSVEALVLLVVFLVLPLIQQLLQAARQRQQRPPDPGAAPGPETRARTPPPPVPPVMAPLPDTTSQVVSDVILRVPAAPRRLTRPRPAAGLRTRRDLRHAMVLVATLGPCRANSPFDWPEHVGPAADTRQTPPRGRPARGA